MIERWR